MLYHYLNAYFQGTLRDGYREGPGIIIDSHNNFISSHFTRDSLNGPTFICLYGNLFIFGEFCDGKMNGINTIDSAQFKCVGRYQRGSMVGKGLVIDKRSKTVYVIEYCEQSLARETKLMEKNDEWEQNPRISKSEPSQKNRHQRWQDNLNVINRYTQQDLKHSPQIQNEVDLNFQQNQIQHFLETMKEKVYCCYECQYELYFGYIGNGQNLGVTFSPDTLKFSSGIYKEPFNPIKAQFQRLPSHTSDLVHNTVFFPELIGIKKNFIKILNFVQIFQEKMLNFQNSEIFINEPLNNIDIEPKIFKEFQDNSHSISHATIHPNSSFRKSLAIQQLNKSLGQLLVMQEEMLVNRRSKDKDIQSPPKEILSNIGKKQKQKQKKKQIKQSKTIYQAEESSILSFKQKEKWLASYCQDEQKLVLRASKNKLKQQLFSYMEQQRSNVIPVSRSKSKSPLRSSPKAKNLYLTSPKARSPKHSPYHSMKFPKSILKNKKPQFK